MFYTVYQITNKTSGKIYIGVHTTHNLNDNYLGSGKLINKAISKYGEAAFQRKILFVFSTKQEMLAKEAELVTAEFIARKDVYNIILGGDKGYSMAARLSNNSEKGRKAGLATFNKKVGVHSPTNVGKVGFCHPTIQPLMRIKAQSKEARFKRRQSMKRIKHQQGWRNAQFNKIWITNGSQNKLVNKDTLNDWTTLGFKPGRVLLRSSNSQEARLSSE